MRRRFENPPREYRGTPFWAWNCRMTKEQVDHTLQELKEMGMGGAYFHCRTGMDMPYLGPEFMEMMQYAHKKAQELGLMTCLYDEDRWPSGFAGGLVTREEQYRSRFLAFSPDKLPLWEEVAEQELTSCAKAVSSGRRRLLARYEVELEDGYLKAYRRLKEGEDGRAYKNLWYAYLEIAGDNPWFNNQAYVNTLDPKAVRRFLDVTYEAYYREFGKDFGTKIPYIFTDEPQFSFKTTLGFAKERTMQTLPYTDDFEETFYKAYGTHFLDHLPEVFWDLPDGQISVHRYHYHDHVCERFVEAYADQIGGWCQEHGIALTGHMMREPFLEWQTYALGEAMRSYRSFGVPGIDMLCDRRELTTAKQAQSAVHQYHCPGMTSELYGVTNWDFDFRGHKLAGDWQAALGVTRRTHHLTWTTMAGEAKRDYPAPIGYQSPWYREYPYIEDYFARLNTVLSQGEPVVKVGVIHPIESYWLYWGTREHTEGIRKDREDKFQSLVKWLLYGLMDFDFISESLLADFQQEDAQGFQVGAMHYDAILIPDCVTLRGTTMKRLEEFALRGGKVVFAGQIPTHVDAIPSEGPGRLAETCRQIAYSRYEILESLKEERLVDVRMADGSRSENMLYQMRRDGDRRFLFLCHSEKPVNPDLAVREELQIQVKGCWKVEKWNPQTGEAEACRYQQRNGTTCWREEAYEYDSFLYELEPGEKVDCRSGLVRGSEHAQGSELVQGSELSEMQTDELPEGSRNDACWKEAEILRCESVPVILDEPNVLLLDQAEYALDGEPWSAKEEILRLDNVCRKRLGYPLRTEAFAQPWVDQEREVSVHSLKLRFEIEADYAAEEISLALETPEQTRLWWNGTSVSSQVTGWYTDRDIKTVKLPGLKTGTNELIAELPYTSRFHVEAMYLLGDFGVRVAGRTARITEPVRMLAFGDICHQGLPFYGGNICYQMDFRLEQEETLALEATKFRCPVIRGSLDGQEKGYIAIAPYRMELGRVQPGHHRLELIAFGNRVNTFGPVHNCNQTEQWIGPNAWRSSGSAWSYEYQLKPTGILISPVMKKRGQEQAK